MDEDELFKSRNGLTAAIEYLAAESGRLRLEAVRQDSEAFEKGCAGWCACCGCGTPGMSTEDGLATHLLCRHVIPATCLGRPDSLLYRTVITCTEMVFT